MQNIPDPQTTTTTATGEHHLKREDKNYKPLCWEHHELPFQTTHLQVY